MPYISGDAYLNDPHRDVQPYHTPNPPRHHNSTPQHTLTPSYRESDFVTPPSYYLFDSVYFESPLTHHYTQTYANNYYPNQPVQPQSNQQTP
jgi:hypothetical protein